MTVEQKVKAIFEAMSGDEEYDELSNSEKWNKVQKTWIEATNNVILSAKGNAVPKITESMKARRLESCFGKENDEGCAFREFNDKGKYHYCNVCGCGGKSISKLDGKGYVPLDFPGLECPLRRLGFANELVQKSKEDIEE
jgi:hypothetical protein